MKDAGTALAKNTEYPSKFTVWYACTPIGQPQVEIEIGCDRPRRARAAIELKLKVRALHPLVQDSFLLGDA